MRGMPELQAFIFEENKRFMKKVAILVDGGFYRKVAALYWGKKTPQSRAEELISYCRKHLLDRGNYTVDKNNHHEYSRNDLYRIYYYDCPTISKVLYHPLLQKNIDLSKNPTYQWMLDFIESLRHQRKLALRLGILADSTACYSLKSEPTKKLLSGRIQISDLTESDFELNIRQKGVDMKIGIDIASLAYKKQVDQIVLISGDSDFVPAAKLARREGIDFILDPMGTHITSELEEHIDGLQSYYKWNIGNTITKREDSN